MQVHVGADSPPAEESDSELLQLSFIKFQHRIRQMSEERLKQLLKELPAETPSSEERTKRNIVTNEMNRRERTRTGRSSGPIRFDQASTPGLRRINCA